MPGSSYRSCVFQKLQLVSLAAIHNKAFKSDSQRLAVSLRSSIAKRRSHLNAALCLSSNKQD